VVIMYPNIPSQEAAMNDSSPLLKVRVPIEIRSTDTAWVEVQVHTVEEAAAAVEELIGAGDIASHIVEGGDDPSTEYSVDVANSPVIVEPPPTDVPLDRTPKVVTFQRPDCLTDEARRGYDDFALTQDEVRLIGTYSG
jgi:hypothetical protein